MVCNVLPYKNFGYDIELIICIQGQTNSIISTFVDGIVN